MDIYGHVDLFLPFCQVEKTINVDSRWTMYHATFVTQFVMQLFLNIIG